MSFPEAEIEINEELVSGLIQTQFPEFSDQPISFLSEGYDNANFRLGNSHLIRLPRRTLGSELISNEIIWLPKLEPLLPIPVPSPVHVGKATKDYPWLWTINPFFEGTSALNQSLKESELQRLIIFLKELHQINPEGVPENPYRDLPLSEKATSIQRHITTLESKGIKITEDILQIWKMAAEEPIDSNQTLIHGDLHPDNIILNNRKIEAVIDWGDLTKGDPATDLASIWMLTDDPIIRSDAFDEYGATPSTILRSKGWAIFYGITFLTISKYQSLGKRAISSVSML